MRRPSSEVLKKPAPYGPDIDLEAYEVGKPEVGGPESAPPSILGTAPERLGIDASRASYVQVNELALYKAMERSLARYGVRVIPLALALRDSGLARELAWRIVDPETDKYTAYAYEHGGELGYFIFVPPGTKLPTPIYSCLAITSNRRAQLAHNVIYVGESSEVHVVTGCAVPHGVREGLHIGVSEFYVGRGARLTFSMIHAWAEGLHVRPRTAVKVEEGGEFVSYYVIYSPVASLQTFPRVELERSARLYSASVIAGSGSGIYDVGSKAVLAGEGSSAEIISRVVARDNSRVFSRAEIVGKGRETRGHVECLGLLLSRGSAITSIPEITSESLEARLSHEAAIGMLAQEELEYLMSKGFSEDEAKSVLVRGFMSVEAPGIPSVVRAEIDKILDLIAAHAVG
ncbi:MAG: SufD family Fe-S cluster assembly protein [Fervidicoccaceae archaeon]